VHACARLLKRSCAMLASAPRPSPAALVMPVHSHPLLPALPGNLSPLSCRARRGRIATPCAKAFSEPWRETSQSGDVDLGTPSSPSDRSVAAALCEKPWRIAQDSSQVCEVAEADTHRPLAKQGKQVSFQSVAEVLHIEESPQHDFRRHRSNGRFMRSAGEARTRKNLASLAENHEKIVAQFGACFAGLLKLAGRGSALQDF